MPDPISLPNAPTGGTYDLEANACVAAPPAASPAAAPPQVPTAAHEPMALGAGAQQLIDGYAQGGRGSSSGEAAQRSGCQVETLKAVVACGQMVGGVLVGAPTAVGAVVSGVFGGMACGWATAEAYHCYTKDPE